MKIDLSLYLVTDTALCAQRGVPETVRAAVAGGVTAVQVRDPHATARELCAVTAGLREMLAGTGVALLVDDRLDVALASGADGVHLGQSDLPVERAREIAGPDAIIGWSVSDASELATTGLLPRGTIDYLGIGPVFATPTKPDAAVATGIDGLRRLVVDADLPAVAVGGIHADNAAGVLGTGVDGLCVVSEICAAPDPEFAARRMREVRP
ncbi:thiamine phosphate synthase [Parasphingorhabdus pacifica]